MAIVPRDPSLVPVEVAISLCLRLGLAGSGLLGLAGSGRLGRRRLPFTRKNEACGARRLAGFGPRPRLMARGRRLEDFGRRLRCSGRILQESILPGSGRWLLWSGRILQARVRRRWLLCSGRRMKDRGRWILCSGCKLRGRGRFLKCRGRRLLYNYSGRTRILYKERIILTT